MAVSHKLYGPAMKNLANGNISALTTEMRVALMSTDSAFSFTQDNEYWATISTGQLSTSTVTDYPSSGVVLGGPSLAYAARITTLSATSETVFTSTGSISSAFAVIHASSYLVSCIDFDGTQASVDGKFAVAYTDDKVMTITVSA